MSLLAAGAIAAPIVGGLIGNSAAKKDAKRARELLERAAREFEQIEVPELADQVRQYELAQLLGEYSPELEQLVELGPTEFEDVAADPRLAVAQMQALETLSDLGETGLTSGEQAALREVRRNVAGEEQARQNAILQEFARRGQGGAGMELAARLQSSQSAADRGSAESDRLMQLAQDRALQAITQGAGLAGNIRSQDFGEQAQIASAQDAIARFNAQNQQALQARNTEARNQAQLRNLSERQRIAEQNTATRNLQQDVNKDLANQRFNQQIQRAQGLSGQLGNVAGNYQQTADRTAQMWAGIGQGIGSGLSAASLLNRAPASPAPTTSTAGGPAYNDLLSRIGRTS